MFKRVLLLVCIALSLNLKAQYIPEHISNEAIYAFLDELATDGHITLNSAVKPYSRDFIFMKLKQAKLQEEKLNNRQRRELDFYMKSYRLDDSSTSTLGWKEPLNIFKKNQHLATSLNPFGLSYKDSLFTFQIRPVYGYTYEKNENGSVFMTHGGLEAYATIDRHWGIYANFRDSHESELLGRPGFFTLHPGGAFKENNGGRKGGDYSEMRGGATYQWKWGDVGLVKDHFTWGSNYHGSNIFSGRTPSFTQIRLHLQPAKWVELNYVHGWLVSEVIDSSRSYFNNGTYNRVYKQKFLAANFITITPFKRFNFSVGNSIVYSDLGGMHPAYLIPVAFYKSIDHTLNHAIENQNSQLFFDVSSRQIKHLHLYASVFVDEFSITRLKDKEAHNFISWKGGFEASNFPLKNVILITEFTQTTPITYKHDVPSVTFASNLYSLGHYMGDNSRELYINLCMSPLPRFRAQVAYTFAEHGNEYAYIRSTEIASMPMLKDIVWKANILELKLSYQALNNIYVFCSAEISDIESKDVDGITAQQYLNLYTPAFLQGKTNTIIAGFSLGF